VKAISLAFKIFKVDSEVCSEEDRIFERQTTDYRRSCQLLASADAGRHFAFRRPCKMNLTTCRIFGFVLLALSGSCSGFVREKTPLTRRKRGTVASNDPSDSLAAAALSQADSKQRKDRLAGGMAFLTGFADVALYLKYKTFATMMSGNTLWLAKALIEQQIVLALYYVSLILAYIVGLVSFRRFELGIRKETMPICSFVVALLFIASDTMDFLYGGRWLPVAMLAAAYGIINSVGSEVAGTFTYVVTGHITKSTNILVDRISRSRGRKRLSEKDKTFINDAVIVTGGFFSGALLASLMAKSQALYRPGVFACLGLLYGLLFCWHFVD
jgi:uncharacterized membrane protein YoaK (UPF0700 family)